MPEYLKNEEKKEVRSFWEEIFDEDTKEFLDYYEAWKLPENEILVEREGKRIVSMLHRNPYELALGEGRARCDYIVAVATRADRRHRGLMAGLLKRMARDMNREGMPLCFLMPASEAIYLPFGFTNIWDKQIKSIQGLSLPAGYACRRIGPEEYGLLSEYTMKALKERADIYAVRTPSYYKGLAAGLKSEGGELFWLYKEKTPVGYLSGWPDGRLYEAIGWDFDKMPQIVTNSGEKTMIMARIVSLATFIKHIRAREGVSFLLHLTDPLVEENNGSFLWQASCGGSRIELIKEDALRAAALADGQPLEDREEEEAKKGKGELFCGIDGLTAWLCGYRSFQELLEEGKISADEEGGRIGEEILTFHGVFLPEEV